MKIGIPIALTLLAAASLAGCTMPEDERTEAPETLANEYKDADKRYYNSVGGVEQTTKTFEVKLGSTHLTVKAAFSCGGVCKFTLKDPAGQTKQSEDVTGGKYVEEDNWYSASDPLPGSWKLNVDIQGGCEYAFGFYAEP